MYKVAVLTGDIMHSGAFETQHWLYPLKEFLSTYGEAPSDWEIYRGDEFQLRTEPATALRAAIMLKALMRRTKGLDVRISLGLGEEEFKGDRVTESNGSAYQRSGRTFEQLKKERLSLAINSGRPEKDANFNLILRLSLEFMDHWSTVSAEIMGIILDRPGITQRELAELLQIQQSAVSQRLKRARKELVYEILEHYNIYLKPE